MRTGKGRAVLVAFCSLVGLVLVAPTLVVIPMSFTDRPTFQFPPKGWSTRWYENFFSDPAWYQSALNSLKIASIVVVLATVLGTAAAFGLTRGRGRWRAPAQAMLLAPMIVPGVVTAIAIYYVFLRWHLVATTPGFVLAHTLLALPLVVVTVSSTLQTMDRRLEQAAASLGAGPLATFRRVTLPLIMPGVLTAALFAFITSFDEAIVSLFLVGPFDRTLPVQMYTSVSASVDPTIAAASTMTIILTTSLLFIAAILITRRRARVG